MSGPGDDFYARQGYARPEAYRPPVPPPAEPYPATTQVPVPPPAAPPPSGPPWWRRNIAVIVPWVLVAGLAVTVALLAVPSLFAGSPEASQDAGPATHEVTVNFLLSDSPSARNGCNGTGGYGDIGAGTPVTIKSGAGEILGAGFLGEGSGATGFNCLWVVRIGDVRVGEDFYSAEVGSRGAITQSGTELVDNGYKFDLSLGD